MPIGNWSLLPHSSNRLSLTPPPAPRPGYIYCIDTMTVQGYFRQSWSSSSITTLGPSLLQTS